VGLYGKGDQGSDIWDTGESKTGRTGLGPFLSTRFPFSFHISKMSGWRTGEEGTQGGSDIPSPPSFPFVLCFVRSWVRKSALESNVPFS
jgi:hypothetical protein